MKKRDLLFLAMAVTIISSCADSSALIRANSTSIRSDVFEELAGGGPVPPGYAVLRIVSALKTHKPGIYSVKDIHGTSDYKLLLNIDGQAVLLQGSLREERVEPRGSGEDEAGEGIRYRFSKKMRLKAGTHKVVIAIPADDVAVEGKVALTEGTSNMLVVEPVYRSKPAKRRPGFYAAKSFEKGITGFRMLLNGKTI